MVDVGKGLSNVDCIIILYRLGLVRIRTEIGTYYHWLSYLGRQFR